MSNKSRLMPTITAAAAVAALQESAGTGEAMRALPVGATLQGAGAGEPLPPVEPPAVHEWDDEFTGIGGSYVVIDGRRYPADQVVDGKHVPPDQA